jgi:glycine dehydrogenase subunit 1
VLAPPSAYAADVVVGEGQPLGNPMSFGGPGFGFFAAKTDYLRRMPGRIVGRTVDVDGRDAFVLTMQTREQHIRSEKATSNICSNQALSALAASVHLASLGPAGLAEVGRACVAKAHYLRDRLIETGRFTPAFPDAAFAHEFALAFDGNAREMQEGMLERGFLAGLELSRFSPELSGIVLFAVTEKRTREEIDRFVTEVASL